MCRKLCFLMCFVLVLGLSGAAQATAIDDCRYNLSFELFIDPCDPNSCDILVDDHTSTMDDVLAWEMSESFAGVDVNCGHECLDCGCRDWGVIPDGNSFAYMQSGKYIYQVLNPAFDGNAIIQVGRKYTLTFDATVNSDSPYGLYYSLFYGDNPEANEITIDAVSLVGVPHPSGLVDWTYDLTLGFVSTSGPSIGEPLGIKFDNPLPSTWLFVDDVRMDWVWATSAYGSIPADGAEDVARDANLAWTPGMWADDTDGHHVYFGTSLADVESRDGSVYFGVQSPNSFDPTPGGGQLVLGETYYWAIDEVNDTWPGIPGVPDPPWVGDVWSLEVTGYATNPNPPDEAEDVPFLGTVLSWSPGTDSNSHDVYFGTDEDDVSNATTSVTLGVFIDNNEANSYDPGALMLGDTYYWRIDEVNETAGTLMKGKLWEFTVAGFLAVDELDSYVNQAALWAVWHDYWTNGTQVEVSPESDANFTEDGNSMKYAYTNGDSPYYAEAYADITDLGITSNWTVGGLEALALSFMGEYDNAVEDMYVAVRDGSGRTGKVLYDGDANDLKREWLGFQQWNIELQEFVDDNSVDLTDVDRLTIGLGDKTAGGSGYLYFDNIRLYPPRCVPQYAPSMGSFRYINRYVEEGNFEPDCTVDNYDLWTMSGDWLISGIGDVTATSASTTGIVGHWPMDDDDTQLQVDDISGNANHGLLYDEDRVPGRSTTKHSIDDGAIGKALTFDGVDDYIQLPTFNLNSNTVTVSAWVRPDGMLGEYATYPPIVSCNEPNGFRLCFGSTSAYVPGLEWSANNELGYFWTGWAWDHHSEMIMPPDLWSFVALVVEPTKGTLYLYDGLEVAASTNEEPHVALDFNDVSLIGGANFDGAIDDVYIYNRSLPPEEILDLAGLSGTHTLGLEPWRPDPSNDDKVNFEDYGVMADNWLSEVLWP